MRNSSVKIVNAVKGFVMRNSSVKIVVLSDGETFELLENCEVVTLPDTVDAGSIDAVEEYLKSRKTR